MTDAYWAGRGWSVCAVAHAFDAREVKTYRCPVCRDKGWRPVGDTGAKEDCPNCDLDPPLPRQAMKGGDQNISPSVEPSAVFDDYGAKLKRAKLLAKPLLVVLDDGQPREWQSDATVVCRLNFDQDREKFSATEPCAILYMRVVDRDGTLQPVQGRTLSLDNLPESLSEALK